MDIHQNALTIGTNLHGYQITEILGEGSFGITYKAHDPKLNRFVVIKEYMPKDLVSRRDDSSVAPHSTSAADSYRWGLESFLKEAQTLASFHHPNIVSILDFFEDNGTAYLVMPFLGGETLADRLSRCPGGIMPEAEIRLWLSPLMDGLQTIHAQGVLHRDIKPENIYLLKDGTPLLIDFGAARNALANRSRSLSVVLTPGYAPPEQYASSAANQGPWSDIYALGAVLYRCVTGNAPVDSTERQDATANGDVDPMQPQFTSFPSTISPSFQKAIETSLRLVRKERVQGIAELRHILETGESTTKGQNSTAPTTLEKNTQSQPASDGQQSASRKKKLYGLIATAVVIICLSLAAFYAWHTSAERLSVIGQQLYNQGKYEEAVEYLRKSADKGDASAQNILGICYANGQGVSKYEAEAVRWFHKSAEQGYMWGQLNLGSRYATGKGVSKDEAQAVHWYRKAAEQGLSKSQVNVGSRYYGYGGFNKDEAEAEAVRWLSIVAEQGQADAQFHLGLCYDYGRGLRSDGEEAIKWYSKAAEQGLAGAQYRLGLRFHNMSSRDKGIWSKAYIVEAISWYHKAAKQGNKDAQEVLIQLNSIGEANGKDNLAENSFVGVYGQSYKSGSSGYYGTIKIKQDGAGYHMDVSSSSSDAYSSGTCSFTARLHGKIVAGNEVVFTFYDGDHDPSQLPTITVEFDTRKIQVKDISDYYSQYSCGLRGIFEIGEYKKRLLQPFIPHYKAAQKELRKLGITW